MCFHINIFISYGQEAYRFDNETDKKQIFVVSHLTNNSLGVSVKKTVKMQ